MAPATIRPTRRTPDTAATGTCWSGRSKPDLTRPCWHSTSSIPAMSRTTCSTLAALAEATSRIELIGAIKPLLVNPLVFAKLAGNIAEISGGRLAIIVVSGWCLPELAALGLDAADHDDRYAYTRGWLATVLDLWTGKQVGI